VQNSQRRPRQKHYDSGDDSMSSSDNSDNDPMDKDPNLSCGDQSMPEVDPPGEKSMQSDHNKRKAEDDPVVADAQPDQPNGDSKLKKKRRRKIGRLKKKRQNYPLSRSMLMALGTIKNVVYFLIF
jgi:hypothetical protein